MNKYKELSDLVASLAGDFDKFYDKGNKAAGTRVRAGMAQLAAWAKATRAEVQSIKNGQ
ncbi:MULTISPECIES: histone H1 [Emticicia]|uniref:Histone H1 n=1 Tax=Emticicia agri TaxID=2492393 RepID=A0A4Q5LW19_9BACT|nr:MULTISPECIES: histone H1 [Emticicia]MBA4848752.1 histone H1 [Emticicia sp. BO119]RYU93759.1 histone H1 [Emticicia agri]